MDPTIEFAPWHILLLAIIASVGIVPFWKIFKKAGFPAPLALLMFVPMVNFVLLYFVAFAKWNVVPAPLAVPPDSTK
jgi:hypothetical protein